MKAEETQPPQLSLAELEQRRQQEVRAQQENRRQDSRYDFEPQPQPVNQPPPPQQVQRQPPPPQQVQRQPPPPQQIQRQPPPPSNRGVPPAPANQGQAPFPGGPFQAPPAQRKPLPPRPRPQPKKKPGLLDGLVEGVTCAATELYAADKLNDQVFIRGQIDCLTKKGPCDDLGRLVRRKFFLIISKKTVA